MSARLLHHCARVLLVALVVVNLLWVFVWIGEGPLVVLAVYLLLTYALLAHRRVPLRLVAAAVLFALFVETVEFLRLGIQSVGPVERWLYALNVSLALFLLLAVRQCEQRRSLGAKV